MSSRNPQLWAQTALTVQPYRLTHNAQEYLIAPCIMIVEGVLNGGYVPGEEIQACQWDGIPVVINHPRDEAGVEISANAPEVLQRCGVGRVYRTRYQTFAHNGQNRVRAQAELWLELASMQRLGGEAEQTLSMLETQTPLEVSTAFFSEAQQTPGQFYGSAYREIHRSLQADHLALLPNGIGACNWQAGCGSPRLNAQQCACDGPCDCQERENMESPNSTRLQALWQMLTTFFQSEHGSPILNTLTTARRPTFSGTESTTWNAPTFAIYVSALHAGSTPPASVSAASAALKRQIAAHTLLGDASANTFSDLSFFPVVNPRTGKLNEHALRAVLGGRGSQANIPEAARTSAQNMARTLLNSEFNAELATQEAPINLVDNQTDQDTREALYGALAREMGVDVTPIFLDSLDAAAQTFTYRQGERLIQRSWTMDGDGVLTLGTDATDVQRSTSYLPVPGTTGPAETEPPSMMYGYHQHAQESTPMLTSPVAIKARVNGLIANTRSNWTERDRPMLEKLDEATLIRLEQQPVAPEPPAPTKARTLEELMAECAPEVRESHQEALDNVLERKQAAVTTLMANKKCPFSEEELRSMTAKRLEQMVAMTMPEQDELNVRPSYAGRGLPHMREIPEEEQPPPPPNTFQRVLEKQKAAGQLLH